jgi:hypothetical protein
MLHTCNSNVCSGSMQHAKTFSLDIHQAAAAAAAACSAMRSTLLGALPCMILPACIYVQQLRHPHDVETETLSKSELVRYNVMRSKRSQLNKKSTAIILLKTRS